MEAPAAVWQEVDTLLPARLRREQDGGVILSMTCYRRFDTRAQLVLSYWTVDGGLVYLARRTFDPEGPLSARDAMRMALEEALRDLPTPSAPQPPDNQPELPYGG